MPALVALKDANFGAVFFHRIGRAANQMGIAAAFDAADRPNKSLLLDDEGTLLHSPPPPPDGPPNGPELGLHEALKFMTDGPKRSANLELHLSKLVSFVGRGKKCSAHEHIDDLPLDASRKPAEQLIRASRRSWLKWPRNGSGSPRKARVKKTTTSFEVRNQIPVIE